MSHIFITLKFIIFSLRFLYCSVFLLLFSFFPVVLMQASPTLWFVHTHVRWLAGVSAAADSQHVRGFAHGPPFLPSPLYAERRLNGSVKESSRRVQMKVQAEFSRKGGGVESEPLCCETLQINAIETQWKHSRWKHRNKTQCSLQLFFLSYHTWVLFLSVPDVTEICGVNHVMKAEMKIFPETMQLVYCCLFQVVSISLNY